MPFNYPRQDDDNLLFQDFRGPGRRQMDPTRYQQPNGRRNDKRELYSDYKDDYTADNKTLNNNNRRRSNERNDNRGRNDRRDYRNDYEDPVPGDMGYNGSNRRRETPSQRSNNSRRDYGNSNVRYNNRRREAGTTNFDRYEGNFEREWDNREKRESSIDKATGQVKMFTMALGLSAVVFASAYGLSTQMISGLSSPNKKAGSAMKMDGVERLAKKLESKPAKQESKTQDAAKQAVKPPESKASDTKATASKPPETKPPAPASSKASRGIYQGGKEA